MTEQLREDLIQLGKQCDTMNRILKDHDLRMLVSIVKDVIVAIEELRLQFENK